MERRELFLILGASAVAQGQSYTPKFLTTGEAAALDHFTEILIPADGNSPGARAAQVIRYIDLMLMYGEEVMQRSWRSGIAAVEAESRSRYQRGFAALSRAQQEQIVAAMARNEGQRNDPLGSFFVASKRLTVEAYHYSAIHWQKNMGRGLNVALPEFKGCTHPEHQKV